MAIDTNAVKPYDWGVIVCAGLILILSFFDAFVTVSAGGYSAGVGAWSGIAALGLLLLLAAAAIVAARALGNVTLPTLPVGWTVVIAGLAALGALLVILRAFTYGPDLGGLADVGPGWSGWAIMILAIAETVFAALTFRESGEKAQWDRGATTPGQDPSSPAV